MAISGARIPVSNTYARALAPSINLPSATLTGMPEPVGLLQGSIPQIVPTEGMLNYTPPVIDESGWNLPSSSFDVTQYVKDYWKKKNNPNPDDLPPIIEGSPGTSMHAQHEYAQKKFYPKHTEIAQKAGAAGIISYINGTHSKWQDQIKQEMVDLGVNYKGTKFTDVDQKYSSGQWKDYLDKKDIEY